MSVKPQQRLSSDSIRLDRHIVGRLRDGVRFLRAHGEPDLTLVTLITRAAQHELRAIEIAHNNGDSLPLTVGPLRSSRNDDWPPHDDPLLPFQ